MTTEEWELWREFNPQGLKDAEYASRPCQDCPVSYATEMRAEYRCNGEPGAE
jgi:hypothetical protein